MDHVFISYARADAAHAERLDADLQAQGFRTWRDTRNLDPSADFTGEIESALREASHVVVCLTRDVRRPDSFVRREIAYALQVDQQRRSASTPRRLPLIPLVFPGGELTVLISTWTALFLRSLDDYPRQLEALLRRLRSQRVPQDAPTYAASPDVVGYLNALHEWTSAQLQERVQVLLTLGATEARDAVAPARLLTFGFTVSPVLAAAKTAASASPPPPAPRTFTSFAEAFQGLGGRLLLLGPPGAGKTTTLLAFAREAALERLEDPTRPIPLLASLHTWDHQTAVPEWARSQVHGIDLAGQDLLYLLDGLDELGGERPVDPDDPRGKKYDPRERFLRNLQEQLPGEPVVVSSRVLDYEEIGIKASLPAAVTVQPLRNEQIRLYLSSRGQEALWNALRSDPALVQMARTPLLLALLAVAFEGERSPDLAHLGQSEVFDRYIHSRFVHESARPEPLAFDEPTTRRLLGELAVELWSSPDNRVILPVERIRARLGERADAFVELARRMHFLREAVSGEIEFIHLELRDFCAVRALRPDLHTDRPHRVLRAVQLLGAIRSRTVVHDLIQLLYRQEERPLGQPGVHYHFRWEFREREDTLDEGSFRLLRPLDLQASSKTLALALIEALGAIGDPAAVPLLSDILRSRDPWMNGAAEQALDQIGTPQARAAIAAWRNSLR